jgi:hypothetical protein
MFIPFLVCPGGFSLGSARLEKGKKASVEELPDLTPVPDDAESGKFSPVWQGEIAAQEHLNQLLGGDTDEDERINQLTDKEVEEVLKKLGL